MVFTTPRTACSVAVSGDTTASPSPTMRSTRSTMASSRSTTPIRRGASSSMRLMVSLNRPRVASRFPLGARLLRSVSVSLSPVEHGVDLLDRDVGVQRRLRERFEPLRRARLPVLLTPLSAMSVIMTTSRNRIRAVWHLNSCAAVLRRPVPYPAGPTGQPRRLRRRLRRRAGRSGRRLELGGGFLVEQPHRRFATDGARGGHVHRVRAADGGGHRVGLLSPATTSHTSRER